MPREKIIRGDRVADAIRESDRPFVTTSDIAEYLDVTAQGVRDNANELAEHPEIEKGSVAQSSVYWLSKSDSDNDAKNIDKNRKKRWSVNEIEAIVCEKIDQKNSKEV